MLKSLIDDKTSDKDTIHSYIDIYDCLFFQKKLTAKTVLEIGVLQGGSIKLWNDYFENADVYGIDTLPLDKLPNFSDKKRIKLFGGTDAYDNEFVYYHLSDKKFDMLLDDGPHTLQSVKDFINKYLPLLNNNGILVIEDIQDIKWIEILKELVPIEDKKYIQVFDLRKNKKRYDDILFIINRTLP